MRFLLPLDHKQRALTQEVLSRSKAPFSVKDPEVFREEVRRLWSEYQRARGEAKTGLFSRLDSLLYQRKREEYIDDPTLPDARRVRLIRGLHRFNRVSGVYWLFSQVIRSALKNIPPGPVTVLDIGSGHGAFPIQLSKQTFPQHQLRVIGSDIEPAYVMHAQESAREQGAPAEFRMLNALALDGMEESFDIITCTQTIHHFPPEFVAELIYRARRSAKRAVLFFDGRRSVTALVGASMGALLLNADWRMAHDGFVSVRRMYTPEEFLLLAKASGCEDFEACHYGPYHSLLEWRQREAGQG